MTWAKFQGFVGPSYSLNSRAIDSQRLINMYPEMIESGTGKEGQVAYLKSIPGYEKIMDIGNGPLRLIHIDSPPISTLNPTNRILIVSGSEVFRASYDGVVGSWDILKVGDLATSEGMVSAQSLEGDLGKIVLVDGVNTYLYWKYQLVVPPYSIIEDCLSFLPGFGGVQEAFMVLWLDGYLIYLKKNSGQFYVSFYDSLSVDPLSFATSEGNIDNIVSGIVNNRDLILFNERSTEIYVNTGNSDFPFERVQGGFIEKGCLAAFSVAKIDSKVFWLGNDEFGKGIVYSLQGMVPQRISNQALEQKISTYTNIENATAYTYQRDGHSFYVINFNEATWCFDLSTGLWHERASLIDGELRRHKLQTLKYFPFLGTQIAADFETNSIYQVNNNIFTFNGEPISRERTFPHISAGGMLMRCNALRIDMEVGTGTNDEGQGFDPKVILTWSDDDGKTWSNERYASIGKIGETKVRVIFRRLGSYRKRVYKLRITDPVNVNILAVDIDVEVGFN